jgi:hypothetical protein
MTRAPAGVGMRLRLGRGVAPKLYGLVDAIIEIVYCTQAKFASVCFALHARVQRLVTICPSMPLALRFLLFTCSHLPGVPVQPMPPREGAGCLLAACFPAHPPQAGWHAAPAFPIPPAGRKRCQEREVLATTARWPPRVHELLSVLVPSTPLLARAALPAAASTSAHPPFPCRDPAMATPGTAAAQSLRTDEIQKVRSPGLGSLPAPAEEGPLAAPAPAPPRSPRPSAA